MGAHKPPSVFTPLGLSGAEAARRLAEVGPNVLPTVEGVSVWRRVAERFVQFFALRLGMRSL